MIFVVYAYGSRHRIFLNIKLPVKHFMGFLVWLVTILFLGVKWLVTFDRSCTVLCHTPYRSCNDVYGICLRYTLSFTYFSSPIMLTCMKRGIDSSFFPPLIYLYIYIYASCLRGMLVPWPLRLKNKKHEAIPNVHSHLGI